jgi:tRNA threonylcarbamoyladenosine modification (KEOPS) complex Cgi121 subunit
MLESPNVDPKNVSFILYLEFQLLKTKFQELRKFLKSINENIFRIVQKTVEINKTVKC